MSRNLPDLRRSAASIVVLLFAGTSGRMYVVFDLLNGLRIVDLTTIVLGPYATQLLADFGADVVKVEPPRGDLFRSAGPGRSERMGAHFINCNRNKRSIVIDLKRPEGLATLYRLIATADVFVHNMRPRSAHKLGLGYDDVKKVRKDIVYCYGCGYGQDGPYADGPAYDDTIQAASGLAFINASGDGAPRYIPALVADKVTGLHLALAMLAGVASRERTGRGACIEVPMLECMTSFLLVELLSGKTFDPPLGGTGYDRLKSPFRKPFATRDGFVSILPYTTAHWTCFLTLIGREDLVNSKMVTDPATRSREIDRLYALIEKAAPERTTVEWLELMRSNDIPCAEVSHLDDLPEDLHLREVGMFSHVDHPTEGRLLAIRSPFNVLRGESSADRAVPILGGDGDEILRAAGFSDDEINELVRSGGVRLPDIE